MKHLRYNSILLIFFILASCDNKESINSKKSNSFKDFVGEWYLMEKKYKNGTVINNSFATKPTINYKDGIKWKIFSDSTVLISYHKQIYRGYSGSTWGPGNIDLWNIEFSKNTNELIFDNGNDYYEKWKINEIDNDKMVLEDIKSGDLLIFKR
jgi:hypothetical protein